MLNIAVAVLTDPIAMQFKQMLKITTNQTAFTGVCVYLLIRERNLGVETLAEIFLAAYKVFEREKCLRGIRKRIITGKCIGHSRIGQHGGAAGK